MREKTPTDFVKRGKQSRGRKQGRGQHNLYETSEPPQPPAALGQQWRRCSDHKRLVGAAMLHFCWGQTERGLGLLAAFWRPPSGAGTPPAWPAARGCCRAAAPARLHCQCSRASGRRGLSLAGDKENSKITCFWPKLQVLSYSKAQLDPAPVLPACCRLLREGIAPPGQADGEGVNACPGLTPPTPRGERLRSCG